MPPDRIHPSRSLLQRRKSLTTTFQAMVDGIIVMATVYLAFFNAQGFFSTIDAVFMITLLAIMGVMGIVVELLQEGLSLAFGVKDFNPWIITAIIVVLLYYLYKCY